MLTAVMPWASIDAGAGARAVESNATWPGDPCCGPGGDDNVAIANQAKGAAATLEPRWMIWPEEEFDAFSLVHVGRLLLLGCLVGLDRGICVGRRFGFSTTWLPHVAGTPLPCLESNS
jgi:hypothetical protein